MSSPAERSDGASADPSLFISYAHIDDRPLTPGQQGWITRFHATLEALLSMRLGHKAHIWRDEKLQGNDVFSEEIVARFREAAVLVSIVTSRYLKSEWCTREAREFCEHAERRGGLVLENKSRVFKVIKMPIDAQEALPAPMRDLLGYDFFVFKDGAPLELDSAYGPEYAPLYNQKVAKLAWDVAQLLKVAARAPTGALAANAPLASPATDRPAVYLAECSFDRMPARELVEGELKRLGYEVLPDTRLPAEEAEYASAVERLLARCRLSIHLVGQHYGAVPNGPTLKSAAVHQNELAAARSRAGDLARLIWLPEGTRSDQPPQQAFIDNLHQDAAAQFGADLVTGDIEELRSAVHATLRKLEQPVAAARGTAATDAKLIYLICDQRDRKATIPLRKQCKQAGWDVALPAFEGEAGEVRKANQQLMSSCDGVLVYYGAGDEAWKRSIDNELKRMASYRSDRSAPLRYTYLAEPRTGDKDDLIAMEEPGLIDGMSGVDEVALAAFLKAVNGAEPAGA